MTFSSKRNNNEFVTKCHSVSDKHFVIKRDILGTYFEILFSNRAPLCHFPITFWASIRHFANILERERERRERTSAAHQLRRSNFAKRKFSFSNIISSKKNKKERASGLIFDEGEREREDGQRLQSTSSANVSDRLQPGYPLPLPNQTNVLRREKESTDAGDASSSKYIFSERLQSSKQNKHHHLTIFATEKFKTKTKTKTILQFTQTYHHNNLTIQR